MDISRTKFVFHGWDSYLSKDQSAIANDTRSNLNEVFLDFEPREIMVGQSIRSGPHHGLVLVPVMTRFYHCGLNFVEDMVECFEGSRVRRVSGGEVYLLS